MQLPDFDLDSIPPDTLRDMFAETPQPFLEPVEWLFVAMTVALCAFMVWGAVMLVRIQDAEARMHGAASPAHVARRPAR